MIDDAAFPRPGAAPWQQPFHWWGPPWNQPAPKTISQLVKLGMLTGTQAAWLIEHVRTGGSIVVAALPQGAGKSTLADALISELPAQRVRVYLRGMYEPFDWLTDTSPRETTILVNEISPHLPIYAWGDTVRRLMALGETGYQIIATVHAGSPEELIAQLASYPIRATPAQLAALDVVVFITVGVAGNKLTRRVSSIVALEYDEITGGLAVRTVDA